MSVPPARAAQRSGLDDDEVSHVQKDDFARPGSELLRVPPPRTRLFELWHGGGGEAAALERPRSTGHGAGHTDLGPLKSARLRPHSQGAPGCGGSLSSTAPASWSASWSQPTNQSFDGSLTSRSTLCDTSSLQSAEIVAETCETVAAFKAACFRKYRSLVRAWRLLLDSQGVGRVHFTKFCTASRAMGFCDVRKLWIGLDVAQSGFITLDIWDPEGMAMLVDFRKLCLKNCGGLELGFAHHMDQTGSNTVTLQELTDFCSWLDFSGHVQALFYALDVHEQGFITVDNLAFLKRLQGKRPRPRPPRGKLPECRPGSVPTTSTTTSSLVSTSQSGRSQFSLQAMPEVSVSTAMRRRRFRGRSVYKESKPVRWSVPTAG